MTRICSQRSLEERRKAPLERRPHSDRLVDEGRLRDYAEAAEALGLTRARVMNLVLLAPEIQERIAVGGHALSERSLRRVCAEAEWRKQVETVREEESDAKPVSISRAVAA